jgi:hypothetical protein
MGREVKRVATDFEWPLEKVWKGYLNPYTGHAHKCAACENGYGGMAHLFYQQWYGYVEFDVEAHGVERITPNTPALRRFVEFQVDRSIREAAAGTALNFEDRQMKRNGTRCYYTDNGRITREEAIENECQRLSDIWQNHWCHHLNADDVKALVDGDRLADFTRRPLQGIPLEEYIRTRAYYLWVEAGRPDGRADEFWHVAAEEHDGHWLPFWNGVYPTPEEVNAWSIGGFGHDALNAAVCIRARCEREGYSVECDVCKGHGRIWQPAEAEQWADEWEREEPPAGEAYQVWETVSEGSPISPVFTDPRILAEWMANSPATWGAAVSGQELTADQWLEWIVGPGWSPSGMLVNGVYKDGVSAMVEHGQ